MATWSQKQQFKYLAGFVLALVLLVGVPVYIVTYDAPTCFDGVRNGDEQDVDCGGVCEAVCSFETLPAQVLWSRSFKVTNGVYNSVALIENPNVQAEAFGVPYTFKLRDAETILVAERKGRVYIPPQSVVPVFEASIVTGEAVPTRTTLTFAQAPDWQDAPERERPFRIEDRRVDETDTDTRLHARFVNTTLDTLSDVRVVALLFGEDGNVRAASQAFVERVDGNKDQIIIFTWPGRFADEIVRSDIYPIIIPE